MRLSTKSRYAVTAMIDIVIHDQQGPVTLSDISRSQGISLSYLEQLFSKLRRNGLVKGVRGPGGGYRIAKPAEDITIASIISAVDESVDSALFESSDACQQSDSGLTQELWSNLSKQIYTYLDSITLASLLSGPLVQTVVSRQQTRLKRTNMDEQDVGNVRGSQGITTIV